MPNYFAILGEEPYCSIEGTRGGTSDADEVPHILLAACHQDQSTQECRYGKQQRGAFTCTLLDVLRSQRRGNLTYAEVMLHMGMESLYVLMVVHSYANLKFY